MKLSPVTRNVCVLVFLDMIWGFGLEYLGISLLSVRSRPDVLVDNRLAAGESLHRITALALPPIAFRSKNLSAPSSQRTAALNLSPKKPTCGCDCVVDGHST